VAAWRSPGGCPLGCHCQAAVDRERHRKHGEALSRQCYWRDLTCETSSASADEHLDAAPTRVHIAALVQDAWHLTEDSITFRFEPGRPGPAVSGLRYSQYTAHGGGACPPDPSIDPNIVVGWSEQ